MGRKKSYNYIGKKEKEPTFYYHSDHLGSASYLTDNYGKVTQTLNYLPYGEDWVDLQNFNVMPAERNLGVYKFNGKEKDAESGYNYYGARYYDSEKLSWLSVDPMSDKYPNLSPYVYCADNPVKLIDPNGNEIWITGSETDAAYKQIEIGAKKYGIKTSMGANGKISASYIGKGDISEAGQQILDAANRTDVIINIKTTNGKKTSDGSYFLGGAFMGNIIEQKQRKIGKDDFLNPYNVVTANQEINPYVLKQIDDISNKQGQTSIHELLEAYTGAVMALEKGYSSPRAGLIGSFYPEVHNMTIVPQSIPELRIRTHYFDLNGNLITNSNGGNMNDVKSLEKYVWTNKGKVILQQRP